jgi:hypothetical protein
VAKQTRTALITLTCVTTCLSWRAALLEFNCSGRMSLAASFTEGLESGNDAHGCRSADRGLGWLKRGQGSSDR